VPSLRVIPRAASDKLPCKVLLHEMAEAGKLSGTLATLPAHKILGWWTAR